jgi:hypothetical protein
LTPAVEAGGSVQDGASDDAGARTDGAAREIDSVDDLAARGPFVAGGMRELLRYDKAEARVRVEIGRATRDGCARLVFVAEKRVLVVLEDGAGTKLSEVDGAQEGLLAARGPVCVRRGTAVFARIEADAPVRVRFVAWGTF